MNAFKRTGKEANEKLILLAEDHPLNQKVALLLLERMGLQAHVVSNGLQAVDAAKRREYSAILMDCHMPEMDGFEATKEIRRQEVALGRHVPIIAVTALAMAGDRERCLAAGMDDYITKPIDKELLQEKLMYWTGPDRTGRKHSKVVSIFENGAVVEHKDEPINIGQFEEAYGEEAHELILLFISSTHKLIDELNNAVRDNDVNGIARIAHEIKGSSWAIGADEMGRLALFLEQASVQQNGKLIHRTYMRLVTHFHEVEKYVQERLGAEVPT